VRLWKTSTSISEWLPIVSAPFAAQAVSDNFTHWPSPSVIAAIFAVLVINLGWIGFSRAMRRQEAFRKDYPGYRWGKIGG
jgi:hypothetical protein